jgi:hypothetical protein
MPMRTTLCLLTSFFVCVDAGRANALQQPAENGVVFIDANGNGVRDAGERGLAGAVVSNQDAVVVTDANGAFHLPAGGTGVIFVSVPDGYRPVGKFWRSAADAADGIAFALAPAPRLGDFTFVHASDTHISPASAGRTRRLRALVDSIRPAFLLVTGDLVKDALRVSEAEATSYYDLFASEEAQFRTPVWTIPGNHENFGIERKLSKVSPENPLYGRQMYHRYFGPDYYSFTRGGVHFVGLNTVDIDDMWYYGHVDSLQLAWLGRDLAQIPATMPVVTFDHIPFFTTFEQMTGYTDQPPAPSLITVNGKTAYRHTVSNAADVLKILHGRRHVLALGGHLHAAETIEYEIQGVHTRFSQASGVIAPTGLDGMRFPSGVTLYRVHDGVIGAGRFIPLGIDHP